MLTFFRRIRKGFLDGGRTSKYFLYAIGEIALVVIGILIALQINNWNYSLKSKQKVEISIKHIKEEIESNIREIKAARNINQLILEAYSDYRKIYDGKTNEIIASPNHLDSLQKMYPGFFRTSDSVKLKTDLYHYSGITFINLELTELSQIAWETTRTANISNEFEYSCLYELESIYNLQRRVQSKIDKAADALQNGEIKELMSILRVSHQLDHQLVIDYKTILVNIDKCR